MSKVSRVASLDIPSETQFEAKEWRVERLGWIGMALIIILGGLGLLGGEGPFNTLQLGSLGDKIWVESRRVIRNQAPFELKIYATTEQSFVGTTTLHINKSYAETFVIESFSPTLIQEQVTPSVNSYDFVTPNGGPATLVLRMRPIRFGIQHATISIEGVGSQTFWQVILP